MKNILFIISLLIFFTIFSCNPVPVTRVDDTPAEELQETEIVKGEVDIIGSETSVQEVTARCEKLKQTWTVSYYTHTNGYHINGYVIIKRVTISQDNQTGAVVVNYTYKSDPPSYYIENIHHNLEGSMDKIDQSQDYSLRTGEVGGLGDSAFRIMRVGEDIIRAKRDISENESSWEAVLEAAKRQPGVL